jgi:excisionase family DNA binding protein
MGGKFRATESETAWISIAEAAKHLLVTRQRVHQVIKAGGLVARRSGTTWLVSARSVEQRIMLLEQEAIQNANKW